MATQTGGLGEALLELDPLKLRRAELVQKLEWINRSSMFLIDIIKDGYKPKWILFFFTTFCTTVILRLFFPEFNCLMKMCDCENGGLVSLSTTFFFLIFLFFLLVIKTFCPKVTG